MLEEEKALKKKGRRLFFYPFSETIIYLSIFRAWKNYSFDVVKNDKKMVSLGSYDSSNDSEINENDI